jgi:hypothetical protein
MRYTRELLFGVSGARSASPLRCGEMKSIMVRSGGRERVLLLDFLLAHDLTFGDRQ